MKRYLTIAFIALIVTGVYAQHEVGPSLSSQVFSRLNYNPAGIGNSDHINIFNQTRLQWIGYGSGSPISNVLNVHYFNENIKSGFGGTFTYDKIGLGNTSLTAKIAYCYNLDISESHLLSFGLSAGISQFSKDYSKDTYVPGEEELENEKRINPDIDFGIEYSNPYILVGASISHIASMGDITTLKPTQTFYAYVRGAIHANADWFVAPALLYMNSGQANILNINGVVFYQQRYWGGLNFRMGFPTEEFSPSLSIMLGLEWKFLRVGYSYEMGFTIGNYNTHELMLSFNIPTKVNKVDTGKKGKKKKR